VNGERYQLFIQDPNKNKNNVKKYYDIDAVNNHRRNLCSDQLEIKKESKRKYDLGDSKKSS